jgi:serine/threonine protein kinase
MTAAAITDSWRLTEGEAFTCDLTVIRRLGGGAAYEAFLAFDERTYTAVVLKAVRPGQVADEITLRGLRREAEMLGRLGHPALVRALRTELDGPRPHLVLEHLDGPRLSTLVRRHGPLSPQQYLPLAIEVAAALHHLHREGVVHLDVKPSNIIMGAPAKLIDVSVARTVEAAAALTYPVGTDSFMAPEQRDPPRTGTPGPAADVWGLGVTLAEAVGGSADAPYALPEQVPAVVADLVRSCLEPDPGERPTPADLVDALAPVLGDLPAGSLGKFKAALAR